MGYLRGWKAGLTLAAIAMPGAAWSAYHFGLPGTIGAGDGGIAMLMGLAGRYMTGMAEPGTWLTMLGGVTLIGSTMRRRSRSATRRQAL